MPFNQTDIRAIDGFTFPVADSTYLKGWRQGSLNERC